MNNGFVKSTTILKPYCVETTYYIIDIERESMNWVQITEENWKYERQRNVEGTGKEQGLQQSEFKLLFMPHSRIWVPKELYV